MSRIGKKIITLPNGVECKVEKKEVIMKGPLGEVKQEIHPHVFVEKVDGTLQVKVKNPEEKTDRALWGLFGALLQNMVKGVTEGFQKQLEINGVGYRAQAKGKGLELELGYSHSIDFPLPEGVEVTVQKNIITLKGRDKQIVGETAARIRALRKPEPYKGKGIKYVGEYILRKAGKQAKTAE